jgi:hypothetical protein
MCIKFYIIHVTLNANKELRRHRYVEKSGTKYDINCCQETRKGKELFGKHSRDDGSKICLKVMDCYDGKWTKFAQNPMAVFHETD